MEVTKHNSFKEAIESLTKQNKDYMFVRHSLEAGHKVKPHYHNEANEWVVIDNGSFVVRVGEKEDTFNLRNEVLVVCFPKGKTHALSATSKVSYFVFRDREDKTIYAGG